MKGAAACWQPRVRLSNVALTIRRALRTQPGSEASVALVGREAPVLVGTPLVMPRRQCGGHGRNADAAVAGIEGRTVACVLPALGLGLSLALGLARVSVHCRLPNFPWCSSSAVLGGDWGQIAQQFVSYRDVACCGNFPIIYR